MSYDRHFSVYTQDDQTFAMLISSRSIIMLYYDKPAHILFLLRSVNQEKHSSLRRRAGIWTGRV
jgi:hypothetical protein